MNRHIQKPLLSLHEISCQCILFCEATQHGAARLMVSRRRRHQPQTAQSSHLKRGVSLYTLLAAIVVLGVLGSVVVTQFNGDNTKGKAMLAFAENLGQAAKRFHLDTGCYATSAESLYSYSEVADKNSCNQAISREHWHGPYTRPISSDDVRQFGPKSRLSVERNGSRNIYVIAIRDPTPSIRQSTIEACGATEPNSGRCQWDNDGDFFYAYLD